MSEQGKKILRLKGVEIQEDTQDAVVPEQVLEMFQKRKSLRLDKNPQWDTLDGVWNPDGSLNHLVFSKNGEVLYELHFAWNSDGTFSKIIRMDGGDKI
jgi:hypothetical protein